MKKLITTVGTSLIQNAIKNGKTDSDYLDILRDKPCSFTSDIITKTIGHLKDDLETIIKSNDENLSAEISSIYKIKDELKVEIEVFLIATDTILSPLCAEYIKKYFENTDIKVHFNKTHDIIQGLQVKDKQEFNKKGLPKLLYRLDSISQEYWSNLFFNITGGYKGIIPFMTIIAQVNEVPIYYLFEESPETKPQLITIPRIPISFDEELFEKFWEQFAFIEKEEILNKTKFDYQFLEESNSCLEIDNDSVMLNPIGKILWQKYQTQYFIFYCPVEVWKDIQNQKEIQRILNTKFHNSGKRKIEAKSTHKTVHDDGNNPYRIYFFEHEDNVFIYKTFEDHDAHKKYCNAVKFDTEFKKTIIVNSEVHKIKKQ